MKILIVAATKFEIEPLLEKMGSVQPIHDRLIHCNFKDLEIDFLITGAGMVPTAYYSGKTINDSYEAAFNIGICGSFNSNLTIGTVVNVHEDCFSELGAEDGEAFLSLNELNLDGVTKIINSTGTICTEIEKLPKVNGITANTSHGNEKAIEKVFNKFHPMVESMEGAAFMFVCENERIPYVQIRAVSNFVERRNKDKWNIPLAIENLNKQVFQILNELA